MSNPRKHNQLFLKRVYILFEGERDATECKNKCLAYPGCKGPHMLVPLQFPGHKGFLPPMPPLELAESQSGTLHLHM